MYFYSKNIIIFQNLQVPLQKQEGAKKKKLFMLHQKSMSKTRKVGEEMSKISL
jgi:hypothetical protein